MIETLGLGWPDAPKRLEAALSTSGFVQLTDHGIDAAVLAQMRLLADQFFAHDHDEKVRFVHDDPAANRGYRARGCEALSYSLGEASPPDLFESFNAAPDPATEHRLTQQTPWPDEIVPGFSDAVLETFREFAVAW